LKRLGRGVYARSGDALLLHPSLLVLQRQIEGLHVGGKSALDWYGVRQYLSQKTTLQLYGLVTTRLPDWFLRNFPSDYHRKQLFREKADQMLQVAPFEQLSNAPQVSAPERAFLELLSDVGVRQSLQEARELMESSYSARADVLQDLLANCTSVKTVRMCLQFGRELSLPWMQKIDPSRLPTGSARPWVSRSKNGLLVLKR
jgi:hypothetical protein